jgi:hypothetical protein
VTDLSAALRELSEPWPSGDRTKTAIDRAARRAGLSYWRAFDIWYGKARRVEPEECVRIQAALDKRREEAARHELHDLKLRIARLEALMARADADLPRPGADRRRGS